MSKNSSSKSSFLLKVFILIGLLALGYLRNQVQNIMPDKIYTMGKIQVIRPEKVKEIYPKASINEIEFANLNKGK